MNVKEPERKFHIPVMPEEVLEYLCPDPGKIIVDGTVGEGGHSRLIADLISNSGSLVCCDLDPEVIEIAKKNLAGVKCNIKYFRSDYKNLPELLIENDIPRVDGFLIDLGVCSLHLDRPERGFSFRTDGPLDMRFDPTRGRNASDIINNSSQEELRSIFWRFGEEKKANLIAKAIIRERQRKEINSTKSLAEFIQKISPRRAEKIDPATRVFQALRIAVNDELEGLEEFIKDAVSMLNTGGKMVVISFHSLEDQIVKDTFRFLSMDCICPRDFPVCRCNKKAEVKVITRKPVTPSMNEVLNNPRARSAKLRACEKLELR